jgi:hypothetical protein
MSNFCEKKIKNKKKYEPYLYKLENREDNTEFASLARIPPLHSSRL